jgi:hypothetical protein
MKLSKPTRLDHFPKAKDLNNWLENHNLPVDPKRPEANVRTMERATGAYGALKNKALY